MKKKGFTLVEVIISLVLIILIGTITIVSLKKDDTDTTDKSKEELETAVDIVGSKLESSSSLKSFVESSDESSITSFYCLKKETLIKEGIITEDNEIIKNIEDDKYIYVEKDQIGNFIIDTNASKEKCSYLESKVTTADAGYESGPIDNTKNPDGTFKENGYYLEHSLTPEPEANVYNLEIESFKFNVGKASSKKINTNIYTIFILDGSGSMGKTGYRKVKEAVKSLYNNMKNDTSLSSNTKYYSVISFASKVYRINNSTTKLSKATFASSILDKYFSYSGGGTNYASALTSAYKGIKDITPNDIKNNTYNRFFIIFLTDGVDSGYTSEMNTLKSFLRPKYNKNLSYKSDCTNLTNNELKENNDDVEYGKLITVGYDYSSSNLETMSSCNCNNNGNCYYDVDTDDDITEVYDSFLSIISNTITCTTYGYIQLSIELGENFYYTSIGNRNIKTDKIKLICGKTIEDQVQSLLQNEKYAIKFNSPDINEANPEGKDYTIIESINLQFYDKKGNLTGEPVPISVPENQINLATYNVDVIN